MKVKETIWSKKGKRMREQEDGDWRSLKGRNESTYKSNFRVFKTQIGSLYVEDIRDAALQMEFSLLPPPDRRSLSVKEGKKNLAALFEAKKREKSHFCGMYTTFSHATFEIFFKTREILNIFNLPYKHDAGWDA